MTEDNIKKVCQHVKNSEDATFEAENGMDSVINGIVITDADVNFLYLYVNQMT